MTKELLYVLDKIKYHELFIKNDFRLVGGTALSYHIKHRLSEDLDFFILDDLPRNNIDDFIEFCIKTFGEDNVISVSLNPSTIYDFAINDEDINDYQQDWNINGVKVTFAKCSQHVGLNELLENDDFKLYEKVKITSVDTIFKMKSLMFYKRTKSRDYFDLLTLYEKGFSAKLTLQTIQKYELAYQGQGIELLFTKLKHQKYIEELDEPLAGLINKVRGFKEMEEELINLLKK